LGGSDGYIHSFEEEFFGSKANRNDAFSPTGSDNFLYRDLMSNSIGMARLSTDDRIGGTQNPNTLFVHAGIDLHWMSAYMKSEATNMKGINAEFKRFMMTPQGREILSEDGSFLWTRVLATADENIACPLAEQVGMKFQVARIIVGHSPQADRKVKTRCHGMIILADAVMSKYMDPTNPRYPEGNGVVVVMTLNGEKLTSIDAVYTDHRESIMFQPMTKRGSALNSIHSPPHKRARIPANEEFNDENNPPN